MAKAFISQQALKSNLALVRQKAPKSKVVAMIKANAYGHHINKIITALNDADIFAVAKFSEVLSVRKLSKKKILLLNGFEFVKDWGFFAKENIQVVIYNEEQVDKILKTDKKLKVWLKVDTLMHRLGLDPSRVTDIVNKLQTKKNIKIMAIMSHFACADEVNNPLNEKQRQLFEQISANNISKSLANSAAILSLPNSHYDFVRPGIMLYGISPFGNVDSQLTPVMKLVSKVLDVKSVIKGESVGYGQTWLASEDSNIAIIDIGYGDGYPRHARNGTAVIINNKRCKLVGRVSMDLITVDISSLKVNIGDDVILWGDESLRIEEVAECSQTIGYELTCKITSRVDFEII